MIDGGEVGRRIRQPPGEHLVQNHADGPQVGAGIGGFLGKIELIAPSSSYPLGFHHAETYSAEVATEWFGLALLLTQQMDPSLKLFSRQPTAPTQQCHVPLKLS